MEFLKYEIKEIESAALKEGEDEELEELFQRISHSRDILSACASVHEMTSNGGVQRGRSARKSHSLTVRCDKIR